MTASRRSPDPLPRDARAMLAAYREAEELPASARERIWAVVGAEDAPEPAFDPLAEAEASRVPRPVVRWIGVGLVAAAALVLAWWLGGSIAERRQAVATPSSAVMQGGERAGGRARVVMPAAARSHDPTPAELPVGSVEEHAEPPAMAVEPGQRRSPREPGVSARPAAPSDSAGEDHEEQEGGAAVSTLADERALVARAWQALAQGNTAGALSIAAEHARRFEEGLLVPEREAVETIARCRRGEGEPAARARAFHTRHPRSPLAGRVDDACRPAEK